MKPLKTMLRVRGDRDGRLHVSLTAGMVETAVRLQIALGAEAQRTEIATVRPLLDVVQPKVSIYSAHRSNRYEAIDTTRYAPVRQQIAGVAPFEMAVQFRFRREPAITTDVTPSLSTG